MEILIKSSDNSEIYTYTTLISFCNKRNKTLLFHTRKLLPCIKEKSKFNKAYFRYQNENMKKNIPSVASSQQILVN